MKHGILKLLFLVSSGLLVTAGMNATSLTFTGLSTNELVLSYYNSGLGSFGSGPGPAYGITFDSNFQVLSTGVYGPPADRAVSVLANGATFNDLPGIFGEFSFYYKDFAAGASAILYAGANGTGTALGILRLGPGTIFQPVGIDLSQQAHSVVFSSPGTIGYITFGALVIPEPGVSHLVGAGLLLLFLTFLAAHAKALDRV